MAAVRVLFQAKIFGALLGASTEVRTGFKEKYQLFQGDYSSPSSLPFVLATSRGLGDRRPFRVSSKPGTSRKAFTVVSRGCRCFIEADNGSRIAFSPAVHHIVGQSCRPRRAYAGCQSSTPMEEQAPYVLRAEYACYFAQVRRRWRGGGMPRVP